jgi:hypothetical protein
VGTECKNNIFGLMDAGTHIFLIKAIIKHHFPDRFAIRKVGYMIMERERERVCVCVP